MSSPVITVLMAVYNGENHLRPTIESILNQTFKDCNYSGNLKRIILLFLLKVKTPAFQAGSILLAVGL